MEFTGLLLNLFLFFSVKVYIENSASKIVHFYHAKLICKANIDQHKNGVFLSRIHLNDQSRTSNFIGQTQKLEPRCISRRGLSPRDRRLKFKLQKRLLTEKIAVESKVWYVETLRI